jgi:hypothetical protein
MATPSTVAIKAASDQIVNDGSVLLTPAHGCRMRRLLECQNEIDRRGKLV